jgi:hypothetical protein
MSTAAPRALPSGSSALKATLQTLDPRLRSALKVLGVSEVLLVAAGAILASYVLDRLFELSLPVRIAILVTAVVLYARAHRRARRRTEERFSIQSLAETVERYDPALEGQILNALELPEEARRLEAAGSSSLERALAERAAREAERAARAARGQVARALDLSIVWKKGALACVLLLAVLQLAALSPDSFGTWFRRNILFSRMPWPRHTHFAFDRKDAEWHHARKDPLEIAAWVAGAVPRNITLRVRSAGGERAVRLVPGGPGRVILDEQDADGVPSFEPGTELEGKRLFHVLPAVTEPLDLQLEGGDNRSRRVRVILHERPRVVAVRFTLRFPEYLGLETKELVNPGGDIVVPAGTVVAMEAESDQELLEGWIRFGAGERTAVAPDGKTIRHELTPDTNGFLELAVTATEFRLESQPPLRFGFAVLPDRPPSVTLALEGDSRVMTPAGKIGYSVAAEDDHGFSDVSLRRTVRAPQESRPDEEIEPVVTPLERREERAEKVVRAAASGELDLAPLVLEPGTTLVLQASASDNDGISGPKTALSAPETILILDPEKFLEEMERVRIEAQAAMEELARREDLVAGRLSEWAEESPAGQAAPGTPRDPTPGSSRSAAAASRSGSPAGARAAKGSASRAPAGASRSESSQAAAESAEGSEASEGSQGSKGARGSKGSKGAKASGKQSAASSKGAPSPSSGDAAGEEAEPGGARPESSPSGEEPADPRAAELAREQASIGSEARATGERLRNMVSSLRRNQLLDPAEERRFRDEVDQALDRISREDLPRSADEIESIPRAEDRAAEAREESREAERISDAMQKVADRLAGTGDFREILFRLERIIELQRRVIGETEKGAPGVPGEPAPAPAPKEKEL